MISDTDRNTKKLLNEYDKINTQNTKTKNASDKSFTKNNVLNSTDLERMNYNSNVYVGNVDKPGKNITESKYIGCMNSGIDERYKVDLIYDEIDKNNVFKSCEESAKLSKNPFFAVGTQENKNSGELNYACYVGDKEMIKDYSNNDTALINHEIATYNTQLIRSNMGLNPEDSINNEGGYMKIEDGTLKIYNSSGTLIASEQSEYSKTVNLYSANDDTMIEGISTYISDKIFLDNVISATPTNYIRDTFNSIYSDKKNSHIFQEYLTADKTHEDIKTICNDLEDCIGYQYIKDSNNEAGWILFKKGEGFDDLKKIQNVSSIKPILKTGLYMKPENMIQSVLLINNDGSVVLSVGGNDIELMKPPKGDNNYYIKNDKFLHETLKDSMGNPKNYITHGERMDVGQFISSPNGVFRARFNENGMFVLETTTTICPVDDRNKKIAHIGNSGQSSDAIYMLNNYRYTQRNNAQPRYVNDANLYKKMENVSKLKCIDECNQSDTCKSISFYKPKNKQYNCLLYNTSGLELNRSKNGIYMKKRDLTKEQIEKNINKAGYINTDGELYTYSPDQLTYEYTNETKDNMNWRDGYSFNKHTYVSKKDMERLEIEAKYFKRETGSNGQPMTQDLCADICTNDPYCSEFAYYNKKGDKTECGIIKKGAVYDKIPSTHGTTYTRIPRVKNEETHSSVSRHMINIEPQSWDNIGQEIGPMSKDVMGPKAIALQNNNNLSGFTTIREGAQSSQVDESLSLNQLKKLYAERKKVISNMNNIPVKSKSTVEEFNGKSMWQNIREGANGVETTYSDANTQLELARREHVKTKNHLEAMHDSTYIKMNRETTLMGNLIITAVVATIFGIDFIKYASS